MNSIINSKQAVQYQRKNIVSLIEGTANEVKE